MDLPLLDAFEEDWEPLSRIALALWIFFYALFMLQAFFGRGPFLWIDLVFIPIHEGGHLLFGYFGHALGVAGGTILQLFVPFALATYFALRRQVPGTAFCAFFFFEQLLPISTYMADARRQALPLLTVGDAEYVEHDWYTMFSAWGVLRHDSQIAAAVRLLGWLGMLATVAWMVWRARAAAASGN